MAADERIVLPGAAHAHSVVERATDPLMGRPLGYA